MTDDLLPALVCALIGAGAGWFVPRLIASVPEPEPEPDDEPAPDTTIERAAPEKEPYVTIAARPGLAWQCALAGFVAAGLVGFALGWDWALPYLLYLVPVGTALAVIDWRTWLLPTRLIAPSYGVVLVGILIAFVATRDVDDLVRAGLGWLVAGAFFGLSWLLTPAMGYGDVRLSGLLGLALGWLGWGELGLGLYAGIALGALAWIPLRLLGVMKTRAYPYGPWMLVGALVGILWGADLSGYLADRWT